MSLKLSKSLPQVIFPREEILSLVNTLPKSDWEEGRCRNGIYWPVTELRKLPHCELMDSLVSFISGLEKEIKLNHNIFLSSVHAGGLPVHYDQGRSCAINFPLSGDQSEFIFVDDKDNIIESLTVGKEAPPYLVNTRARHGVIYPKECLLKRIVLSVSIYEPFDKVLNKIDQGQLFQPNENFRLGL